VTSCDACLVYLADHASGEWSCAQSQLPHDAEIGNLRLKMGEGLRLGSCPSVRGRAVRPCLQRYAVQILPGSPGGYFELSLSVPLISSGELIGVIKRSSPGVASATARTRSRCTFIGEQNGGALARPADGASQSAVKRMETLAAVAKASRRRIISTASCRPFPRWWRRLWISPVVSIMLVDEEKRELVISALAAHPPTICTAAARSEDSLLPVVRRAALVVPNVLGEKQYPLSGTGRRTDWRSLLSAP